MMNKITQEFIYYLEDNHRDLLMDKANQLIDSESTPPSKYIELKNDKQLDIRERIMDEINDELYEKNFQAVRFLIGFLEGWGLIDFDEVENRIYQIRSEFLKNN